LLASRVLTCALFLIVIQRQFRLPEKIYRKIAFASVKGVIADKIIRRLGLRLAVLALLGGVSNCRFCLLQYRYLIYMPYLR
jgi:hypothetical protein